MNQQQMGELYQTAKSTLSEHIKNILQEGELVEKSVVRNFRTTASDGKNYNVTYYALPIIELYLSNFRLRTFVMCYYSLLIISAMKSDTTSISSSKSKVLSSLNLPSSNFPIKPALFT